ncbi:MAG: hypothetical protein COB66_06140 [Coxiella sp. (in: Bacteria)]|nr:MAG: hypothetical protein COB66_06140 [Coxiella sp. (in: g-proteobacteria)]
MKKIFLSLGCVALTATSCLYAAPATPHSNPILRSVTVTMKDDHDGKHLVLYTGGYTRYGKCVRDPHGLSSTAETRGQHTHLSVYFRTRKNDRAPSAYELKTGCVGFAVLSPDKKQIRCSAGMSVDNFYPPEMRNAYKIRVVGFTRGKRWSCKFVID